MPTNDMIHTVVSKLQDLKPGERQALQIPFNLPGHPQTIPGRAFFELMSLDGMRRQHRNAWHILTACWSLDPHLHDPRTGLGTAICKIGKDRATTENQFLTFLNAHRGVLLSQVHTWGRRLAAAHQPYNFGQLADVALDPKNKDLRMRIAEDFYSY